MKNTDETQTSHSSFEKIAADFSESAASLLTQDCIQNTLKKEEKRFENASALQISPIKFIGGNTARHCKDLLRRNQPLFPLYLLLCLLTEGSMVLLMYGLAFAGYQHLFLPEKNFTSPYPVADGMILITAFLLFQYSSREAWTKELARTWDNPGQARKTVTKKRGLSGILILLLCAAALLGIHTAGLSHSLKLTILDTLILYAACAFLSGIHNLIYDSHIIAFLTVGADTLDPRKSPHSTESARHYIHSSLEQILGGKMPESSHSQRETAPQKDAQINGAKDTLRSRLHSFRIYAVLAGMILLALDCLCIFQLLQDFSLALFAFTLAALLGTCLCLVVILSCQTVLRELKTISSQG